MYLYIFLLIYVLIISALYRFNIISKLSYLVLTFVVLAYVQGNRDTYIGTDTRFYENLFHTFKNIPFQTILSSFPRLYVIDHYQTVETGYILFNRLIGCFTNNAQVLLMIIAFILCFSFAKFIYDNSVNPIWSTLLFMSEGMYINSFNMMRQMLAISICINSFTLFKNGKKVWAIFIILIASLIHESAYFFIAFLLFYWMLGKVKSNKKKYFFLIPLLMPIFIEVLGVISYQYSGYTRGSLYSVHIGRIALLWLIILIIAMRAYKYFRQNSSYIFYFINYISFVVLQFMSILITGTARISYWFEPFVFLLVPLAFNKSNKDIVTVGLKLVLLILLVGSYLSFTQSLLNGALDLQFSIN